MNANIPIEIEIKNECRTNTNIANNANSNNKNVIKLQPNNRINNQSNLINYDHNARNYNYTTNTNVNNNITSSNANFAYKTQNNVQNLSPIKPSFVNIKDEYTAVNNFTHSTPNNQMQIDLSPPSQMYSRPIGPNGKPLPLIVNTIIEETTFKTEHTIKKQKIVKELAVNILELNGYKTRTEQLDNELKNCMKIKKDDLKSVQPDWVTEKSQAIQNELSRLKSEMMQKIEDIHKLELELVKLEGTNATNNRKEITNLAYRNEEVINEIRKILNENGAHSNDCKQSAHRLTANKVLDEYSKTNNYLQLKDNLQQRFDFLKSQIEQEYSFLRNRLRQLDEKFCQQQGGSFDLANLNNEIECIKNLVRTSKEKYDQEKNFLYKDLNSNDMLKQHFISQKNLLERVLSERQNELQSLMRNFYSKLPYNSNNYLNETTTASLVITNNNNRSELSCNLTTNNSSFLTEEEEAIKKISDKIRSLKAKIDSKKRKKSRDTITSVTEETNTSSNYNNSNEFYEEIVHNEEDSDENNDDEIELINLNEQIQMLKSKMQQKGDELSSRNVNKCYDDYNIDYNVKMIKNGQYEISNNLPVYSPANNGNNNMNINSNDYMGTYRIEPIEIQHPSKLNEQKLTKKVIIIDKNNPINKKYKSTIEIHADHLQKLKSQPQTQKPNVDKTRCRSLSSARSSTSTSGSCVTVSSRHHYNRMRHHNSIAISHNSKTKRRHQSAVYIKHIPNNQHPNRENLVSVNLNSYKKEPNYQEELALNLEKSQKEIENLRLLLSERNELIEKQKQEHDNQQKQLLKLNESKLNDLKYNDQLMQQLEEQKLVIVNLKSKLSKLKTEGNLDSDTMSCISNTLDKVRQNVKQNFKNIDENNMSSKANNNNRRRSCIDASVQATETNMVTTSELPPLPPPPPPVISSTTPEELIETSLVCNIPEHHKLEDLVHENRDYISKLKAQLKSESNFDEMMLLEKKAEFEALDLAINSRKQQLYSLEMKKNKLSELNQTSSSTSNENNHSLLKEEINCLEQTLRKRTKELDQIESQIKHGKKELNQLTESKYKAEKDLEMLVRRNREINKELCIFDKKAEEATINLIVAQEELDWAKDLKKTIEYDVEKIKAELVNYLRRLKANNFDETFAAKSQISSDLYLTEMEQKKLISEQRKTLEALTHEIELKKTEIDSLKDSNHSYARQLKAEIEKNETNLVQIKKKHECLQTEINEMKHLLDELNADTKLKQQSLTDKNLLIQTLELSIKKFKQINEEESKKLDELEQKINEKYNDYENVDKQFKKLCDNIGMLQADENELINTLEKLNNDVRGEKDAFEKLKQLNDELNMNKCDLENKLNNLTETYDKLTEEFNEREQQVIKYTNLAKEKQLIVKKEEDQLADLEYQKENLNQETNALKDKYNRKKLEYERLEQNNKQLNEKFTQNESDVNTYAQKLFEAKQHYDKIVLAIKEADYNLKDLSLKNQNKQLSLDQINTQILERKEEITGLDTFLDEIRRETHLEKKELNMLKNEIGKQKKTYDELKAKCKNYAKYLESTENGLQKMQDLSEELKEKSKYIRDLETNLAEKTKELNALNQNFLKSQEETQLFKNQLKELDEASKRDFLLETDLKHILCSLHREGGEELKPYVQKPSVSSLLIQPSIRKAYSGHLLASSEHTKSKILSTDILAEKASCILDEQNKFKENLFEKFHEKLSNLDKSKCQTKNIIDNLKSNLNEIEAMTANSIYKLTGIKNL